MADEIAKKEKTETTTGDEKVVGENPEVTTTNDTSIAINQPAKPDTASGEPEKTADSVPATSTETEPKTEDSLIQTPEKAAPVVVSDADVAAAEKESDPHSSLSEQIEVLTGEVQALQAKIEKLTSGVTDVPTSVPAAVPAPTDESVAVATPPTASLPVREEPAESSSMTELEKTDEQPITPQPIEQKVEVSSEKPNEVPTTPAAPQAATPVNDIYTKILDQHKEDPKPHKDLNDDATLEEGSSGIGTIGEVLIVFGLISFLILAASPFVKTTIGTNWEALKSIGWPTATISLGLGFLLFLFNRGRAVFKIFAFLLLLIAGLMTAAIFDYSSMLGPLSGLLDPVASFYR